MRKTLNEIKSLLEPEPEPYRRYVHLMLSISLTNTNTHTARTTGVPMCVHKQNGFFDFDLFYELFSLSVWVYARWFFRFSPSSMFYFTPSPPQAIWINSFSISHSLSHSSLNLSQHKHLTCKSKWIIPPSFSSLSFVFVCTTEYCITSDNVFFYNDMFIVVAVANADANDDAAVVGEMCHDDDQIGFGGFVFVKVRDEKLDWFRMLEFWDNNVLPEKRRLSREKKLKKNE